VISLGLYRLKSGSLFSISLNSDPGDVPPTIKPFVSKNPGASVLKRYATTLAESSDG